MRSSIWPVLRFSRAADTLRRRAASSLMRAVMGSMGAAGGFVVLEGRRDRAPRVGVAGLAEGGMEGNGDKLSAKVDFLAGCAAVYVMAIGASAIKKLMAGGVQPIRINEVDAIDDLLVEISKAMSEGGVAWIDRAITAQTKAKEEDRFASMEAEGWEG